jgi:hypothetical protein
MTITAILRGVAVTLAVLGVIDPSFTSRRLTPVPVEIRDAAVTSHRLTPVSGNGMVGEVRQRLERTLGDRVTFNSAADPAALVLVGSLVTASALPIENIPISTVAPPSSSAPSVRILSATSPAPVPLGWTATFAATIEAAGLRGTTSRIVLRQGEAELAHVEHAWTSDRERFDARLAYAPPIEGSSRVTLRVESSQCPEPCRHVAVDLRAVAIGRRMKILAHEPRPSWATAFVRRALEDDAMFEVASLVRSSRSLRVSSGSPPPALTAETLSRFDVVLIGAPEELRAPELEALRSFARRRGGTVVLLPDRRPSGPYLQLAPSSSYEEMLVDAPLELKTDAGATFRASELAIPRDGLRAGEVLASIATQKESKPVIVAWPSGIGTVVFSGALDAWRYRATGGEGFARFWRARVADAALAAPPRLQVSLSPDIARPGEEVMIHARLRPTELVEAAGRTSVPAVRATAIGPNGQHAIRLWPTAEAGLFEGRLRAAPEGTLDMHVTADNGAVGDDVLTVVSDAAHAARERRDSLELVAASTGGVAVNAADLTPLERYLSALPSGEATEAWHPTRSLWFVLTFVAASCGEWALRRRRGQL